MDHIKEKKDVETLVSEEVQRFGLDPVVLKYEIRRELTARAAKRIADELQKESDPPGWLTW